MVDFFFHVKIKPLTAGVMLRKVFFSYFEARCMLFCKGVNTHTHIYIYNIYLYIYIKMMILKGDFE